MPKAIAATGKPILARMVIVPTRNDQPEDIRKRLDFIHSLGSAVQQVDILEYHIYGIGKYEKLGMPYFFTISPRSAGNDRTDKTVRRRYWPQSHHRRLRKTDAEFYPDG
jgi:pyruvate-formate lyase-activating enzyme